MIAGHHGSEAVIMMSPSFSSERKFTTPKEISEIQKQITVIELHRTDHVAGSGTIKQLDKSCKYCEPYFQNQIQKQESPSEQGSQEITLEEVKSCTSMTTINDLERTVDVAGKKGQIVVPRSWAGKRVRVTLL